MLVEIKSIGREGLILTLPDKSEGWLPAGEWSAEQRDWQNASDALLKGDDLDVLIVEPVTWHEGRRLVSRRLLTEESIDGSWLYQPKIIRVDELTKTLVRGMVGQVRVVAKQQAYADYLNGKGLNEWAKDHAAIGPGDFVGGMVVSIAGTNGLPELDLSQYLMWIEKETSTENPVTSRPNTEVMSDEAGKNELPLDPDLIEQISPTILIENDLVCAESIRTVLVHRGAVVHVAHSPEEARGLLFDSGGSQIRHPFRLAIIDLNLDSESTDNSGFEIIQEFQAVLAACRILMLTGEDISEHKRHHWGHLKVDSCLLKPFTTDDLSNAIAEALTSKMRTPWPDLLDASVGDLAEPLSGAWAQSATEPQMVAVSLHELLATLAQKQPGTTLHIFEIHNRSLRARSISEANGGALKWVPFRGKIAKSPIKDAALSAVPIEAPVVGSLRSHFWTRRMMDYESFYGVPVRALGPYIYSLVAFHPLRNAFNDVFKVAAQVCAERAGRAIERDALLKTRSIESTFAAVGMTLETLAHELRNDVIPMTTMSNFLSHQLTRGPAFSPQDFADLVSTSNLLSRFANSAIDKSSSLVCVRVIRQPVDPMKYLRIAAQRCHRLVKDLLRHPAAVQVEIPELHPEDDDWRVRAAPPALIIIFFNLYLNAAQQIDALITAGIRKNGKIWHSCELRSDDERHRVAVLRVHDSGPGIHPDDWDRVFQPGYTTRQEGTGLGLHICRHLLQDIAEGAVRASVSLTRSVLWSGSTFTVKLPVASVKEKL
jgi:signal transduction histidine kinase/DNA-binding response OmpR family regulator